MDSRPSGAVAKVHERILHFRRIYSQPTDTDQRVIAPPASRDCLRDATELSPALLGEFDINTSGGTQNREMRSYTASSLGRTASVQIGSLLSPAIEQLINCSSQLDLAAEDGPVDTLVGRLAGTMAGLPNDFDQKLVETSRKFFGLYDPSSSRSVGLAAHREMELLSRAAINVCMKDPSGQPPGLAAHLGLQVRNQTLSIDMACSLMAAVVVAASHTTRMQLLSSIALYYDWDGLRDWHVQGDISTSDVVNATLLLLPAVSGTARRSGSDGTTAYVGFVDPSLQESMLTSRTVHSLREKMEQPLAFGGGVHSCPGQHLVRELLLAVFGRLRSSDRCACSSELRWAELGAHVFGPTGGLRFCPTEHCRLRGSGS